jgi:hypothetical protein
MGSGGRNHSNLTVCRYGACFRTPWGLFDVAFSYPFIKCVNCFVELAPEWKELGSEDRKNVAGWDRPSWPQEGWLRPEEKGS